MKMSENDIIAAYVKSRYPNLIKTTDYNMYVACRRIDEALENIKGIFKPETYADLNDLIRKVNEEAEREQEFRKVNEEAEREQKYGRHEEGSFDGSAEAQSSIRGEESICGGLVPDSEQGSTLQED